MKYITLLLLVPLFFSCKAKKDLVHSQNNTKDTFYVENPKTGELQMIISSKNSSPDGEWVLQAIGGNSDDEMSRISLSLSSKNNTISGNDGCNRYSGKLMHFDNTRIEFGPLASTKRARMIPAKFAQRFYQAMQKVRTYQCTAENLMLNNENGERIAQFKKKKAE